MCGIVGYLGNRKAVDVLLNGLSHLEYRGYDSAGVALYFNDKIEVFKASGKLGNLKEILEKEPCKDIANIGIGHIRWATHGLPTVQNAHPHTCNCGNLVLVHNGIIENYQELKEDLAVAGCTFATQTDTEVVAHLVAYEFAKTNKNLVSAVQNAVKKVKGAYAICVMHKEDQGEIVCARKNAPLIIGVGEGENFIASDIPAIIDYTKNAIYLSDNEVASVKIDEIKIFDETGALQANKIEHLPFESVSLSKMGYKHFMLKEIHEQGDVVRNILSGRLLDADRKVVLDDVKLSGDELKTINRIQIIACGTSLHAGLVGKYVIEELTGIPVDVEASSEYIYRSTIADENTLVIGISQSGETADTITAIKQVKEKIRTCLLLQIARQYNGAPCR
jgi:glucosamine--fructose-6-phosphate aminotransferase (isomerizing)